MEYVLIDRKPILEMYTAEERASICSTYHNEGLLCWIMVLTVFSNSFDASTKMASTKIAR